MLFAQEIKASVAEAIRVSFHQEADKDKIVINPTRKEFEGDLTLVTFGLTSYTGLNPEKTGQEIGAYLLDHCSEVAAFNVVKGFLNVSIHPRAWLRVYRDETSEADFGRVKASGNTREHPLLVEYSSPNTNKPLHLGHVRNNLLGYAISRILEANGNRVLKVNLVNDRGIHICKSMLAWQEFGQGETPETSGMKGDHLVGKYYVEFDRHFRDEYAALRASGHDEETAQRESPLMKRAQEMLLKWEEGDQEVRTLWKKMNDWVYEGFAQTYDRLGVNFDHIYYESETYLKGKELVMQGLAQGVFYKKPDGSVWVDLSEEGLDHKLLLRADGTSAYMTQDMGTALLRFEQHRCTGQIYVVGNEQDYHFKVLRFITKKLGFSWWDQLHHLSYAMVDLPGGKMKSREGTVVDADDLMDEMVDEARRLTTELGKTQGMDEAESQHLYQIIGMGALKYFILKVDPEKRMLFNPEESIDFNGHTGPFIQYTHARIRSVLRKADTLPSLRDYKSREINTDHFNHPKEKEVLKAILRLPYVTAEAGERMNPSLLANYIYELSKIYNQFYHECAVVDESVPEVSLFRLHLSEQTARVIRSSMDLLGIEVPERM